MLSAERVCVQIANQRRAGQPRDGLDRDGRRHALPPCRQVQCASGREGGREGEHNNKVFQENNLVEETFHEDTSSSKACVSFCHVYIPSSQDNLYSVCC